MTIDVQPFIDKLEVLKEYMGISLDCQWYRKDMQNFTWRMWDETGMVIYSFPKVIPTFEEFYQQKIKINQCT